MIHLFVDERAMITTTLISSCNWKTLVPFFLQKNRSENVFLKPTVNCRKSIEKKVNVIQTEAVVQRCSVKEVFLKVPQNLQENTFARVSFLINLVASTWNFIKKRPWHRCFPVSYAKLLRTPFLTQHVPWLLLSKTTLNWLFNSICF